MTSEATGADAQRDRIRRLQAVLQMEPDDDACRACIERLHDYVVAQVTGDDYRTQFPDVALHLDACVSCADAYARLYELAQADAADALPEPTRIPEPNLSFLQREIGFGERLSAAIERTGDRLRLQLSAALLPLLRPSPSATGLRAPADSERYSEVLLRLDPEELDGPELPLTVTAYRDTEQSETCLLEVLVEPPGESWPDLGGRTVTLTTPEGTREETTDPWGVAAFEAISIDALDELTIEVTGLPSPPTPDP